MKTVIVTMPMKGAVYSLQYPVKGNSAIEYDGKVMFPINGILAKTLQPKEKVKIIFIVTLGGENMGNEYVKKFKDELLHVTSGINPDISEDIIELPFEPEKKVFEFLLNQLIEKIGKDTEVIADITYGSKPFPFILLCALNFADTFNNVSVLYILYGKIDFPPKPYNPMIYDITSIYYLQKLIGAMENRDAETALKMLNDVFTL
ncbi:TM1812 family CRISPR-associated protein [Leadbettera azotonutricia]|uniref:CRISPR-associated protein n=1 Tax=Leadbettera azotonutricia (strain ATCC BAA-888 / DSM 13862 / ZAS-9) TaxID=545695 RepID=F5YD10_LEAAZ|nr:TM1812 family CRISPR-associated protein [Leadbettera azotonutricia]AEF80555.1 hypothetical protein TREAZ_2806 [Leadbettera azotonutricia ZAS-9]